MENTKLFSDKVDNYVLYRPHYPKEIIAFLSKQIGLNPHWTIADIGSGTGISSEWFLQNGNRVYAVEPNDEMRKAAEAAFRNARNFVSVNGTAEATTLHDKSIDLVMAGQAFHWFERNLFRKESQRIATPDAQLLLMWNERNLDSELQVAYEKMLLELTPGYKQVSHRMVDEKAIAAFFSPQTLFTHSLPNTQSFDLVGLKGRLLSCSYAPLEGQPNYQPVMQRLEQLFEKFNTNGQVVFEYNCKLFYGKVLSKM
jgi:SAM-dependent methyltransferase